MNQRLKSPVREICTLGSVGAGGGRLPPATQWALSDECPYRDLVRTISTLTANGAVFLTPRRKSAEPSIQG